MENTHLNWEDIWNNYLTGDRVEIPEFVSEKLEIRLSKDKGRGVFAKEEIKSGQIFMITKATFYINVASKECPGDECQGFECVLDDSYYESICEDIKKSKLDFIRVKDMCNGSGNSKYPSVDINIYKPDYVADNEDGVNEISTQEIRKIEAYNAFEDEGNLNKITRKCKHISAHGLWCLAGFINHSCIPNSERIFLNEYMINQTTRDIQKDEELFIRYCPNLAYPIRQKCLVKFGFSCNCMHCSFGENTQALFKLTNTINLILRKFHNEDILTALDIFNKDLMNLLKNVDPELDIDTMNSLFFILKNMSEIKFDKECEELEEFDKNRVEVYKKILKCRTFTGPNYYFNTREIGILGIKENNQEIINEYKMTLENFEINNAEIFTKYYEKLYSIV